MLDFEWRASCHAARSGAASSRSQYRKPAKENIRGGLRIRFGPHLLGLAEANLRLVSVPRLVQGVGLGRARDHPPTFSATAVGVGHALLGVPHRHRHLAQRQLQLTQITGGYGSMFPI